MSRRRRSPIPTALDGQRGGERGGEQPTIRRTISPPHSISTLNSTEEGEEDGNWFTKCCSALFRTGGIVVTENAKNKTKFYQATLIEILLYLGYITLFGFVVAEPPTPEICLFRQTMSDWFLGIGDHDIHNWHFSETSDIDDFWDYVDESMNSKLHWEVEVGDDEEEEQEAEDELFEPLSLANFHELIGKPRLRQIRVKKIDCPRDPFLPLEYLKDVDNVECYPPYSQENEDRGRYHTNEEGPEWAYQPEEVINGASYSGKLGKYSGGGAAFLLEDDPNIAEQFIEDLREKLWVDSSTRVVFLEFTVLNANTGYFCVIKLVWEFSTTGSVVPSWSIIPVRLIEFANASQRFIAWCETLLVLYTLYYTIQKIMELRTLGFWKCLQDPWFILDVVVLAISYACVSMYIYRLWLSRTTIIPLVEQNADYINFDNLAYWEIQYWNTLPVAQFFVFIKIIKYMALLNSSLARHTAIFYKCGKALAAFLFFFLFIVWSFAELGHVLFGAHSQRFENVPDSVYALLRLMVGDFEIKEMMKQNSIIGAIYFFLYVFLVFYTLTSMFLAIINVACSRVQKGKQHNMADYICEDVLCCGAPEGNNESTAEGLGQNRIITKDDIREHLLKENVPEHEIDMLFDQYELHIVDDGGRAGRRMKERNAATSQSYQKKNEELERRIEKLQSQIASIEARLDRILAKLSEMNADSKTK